MKLTRKINKDMNCVESNEKYKDLPERLLRNIIIIAEKKNPSSSETRKVRDSGGPIDGEVKEIFDVEAMGRKMTYVPSCFLWRSPGVRRGSMPDILFLENRTYWKMSLFELSAK